MKTEELIKFIDIEDRRLKEEFRNCDDKEKEILARAVKLNEEVGELCNEVLTYCSLQREDKRNNIKEDALSNEFADVIITALLLAKSTNTEILKALENKIEKINQRYKKV